MRKAAVFLCMLSVLLLAGCLKDEVGGVRLAADSVVEVYPVPNQVAMFLFHTGGPWTASTDALWLRITKTSGSGGTDTLKVITTEKNVTGEERMAHVIVESGGERQAVDVRQSGEYALFESKEYIMPAEGGLLEVQFRTNVADSLQLYVTAHLTKYMVDTRKEDSTTTTRAQEKSGSLNWIRVLPNDSTDARNGLFFLSINNKHGGRIDLDTLVFYQPTSQPTPQPTEQEQEKPGKKEQED